MIKEFEKQVDIMPKNNTLILICLIIHNDFILGFFLHFPQEASTYMIHIMFFHIYYTVKMDISKIPLSGLYHNIILTQDC